MINLIVADDHIVVRDALCEILKNTGDYNIVGKVADGEELIDLFKVTPNVDVIILDLEMPRMNGLQTLAKLKEMNVQTPVLILSGEETGKNVRTILNHGARGFIPKNARVDELKFAINSIKEGNVYLSPSITAALMATDKIDELSSLAALTKREVEILTYLADGHPNKDIGKKLHISSRTVDTHRSNLMKKLKVRTNAQLVKIAIVNGLIEV